MFFFPAFNNWGFWIKSSFRLGAIGLLASSLSAQPAQQGNKTLGQAISGATSAGSHYLRITINPSTATIIAGAVYGLNAELENISGVPIALDLEQIQLAVPPELAPPGISCTWLYDAGTNDKLPSPIIMQAGDHLTVFFDVGSRADLNVLKDNPACKTTYLSRLRRYLDFVPGKYAFVLTGKFEFRSKASQNDATAGTTTSIIPETHYFTETAILPVTIDQSQIIIYAGLGGLLAFLVMSFRTAGTLSEYAGKVQATSSKPPNKAIIIVRGASSAILISMAVTVVAARLSTTTFPVKVSVEDFWGALTVGFVSYFIGGKFIDALSDKLTKPLPPPAAPNAPAAVPPAVPPPAAPNAPAGAAIDHP